ncbi:response regulator [Camelimonas sp. ID_303_24]
MTNRKNLTITIAALAITIATLLADIELPIGTAIWALYALPLALTFMATRAILAPIFTALIIVAIVAGYFIAHAGVDPHVAIINRAMGALMMTIMGVTGYFLIRGRQATAAWAWVQTGQVKAAQALQGDLSAEQIGEKFLAALCQSTRARAGVLYARSATGLLQVASWGADAARLPAEVSPGAGHLWRAIDSNALVDIHGDDEAQLAWTSGLMSGRAAWSIMAPTHDGAQVNGVMELGFDAEPGKRVRKLLENMPERIGVALRSARYRKQLQELLEETRRQTEELRSHTEELAASNEELEEQTQLLEQNRDQLEQQQIELEESNARLETQTQQLEEQRDALVRSRRQLADQADQLTQESRYKSEFVANMSHELRTPLNALLIMARLLEENRTGNLSSEQVKWAQTITGAGQDLLTLINDILDLAKIEAGKLDVAPMPVSPGNVASKLLGGFEMQAKNKGLVLEIDVASEIGSLETDPARLEQILRNFLSNAIKFTHTGSVSLRVSAVEDGVAFAVRDTGIGIKDGDQQGVFEAFRQADGAISRRYGGTGLGLSISRELAGLLGGRITLESTPGAGSTFTLTLPRRFPESSPARRRAAVAEAPPPSRPPLPETAPDPSAGIGGMAGVEDDRAHIQDGDRVMLVVEDDPAFARILLDLARDLEFRCIVVDRAEDAVSAAQRYLPQAIVLDVGLPDHSGLSVLDRLKRNIQTRHIPIHVVSAGDHMREAMAQGAMSYLLKPVDRTELAQTIQRLEGRMEQRMRRVLIVEDDPAQLAGLKALLASDQVETIGAATAAEAMAACRAGTFDCIVLDMTLPDASGFDVLEQLDADEAASFPPVIVYTARILNEAEELRLRRYSRSIIIKGAKSPERLIDEVTLFLHQVVAGLPERQREMLKVSLNRDSILEGRRILVVEDDIRNVYALTGIFEPHGVDVQVARNGREALEALGRVVDGAPGVDLVLMDVMMPEMDGLTATREIRRIDRWTNLPIIMLTAKAMVEDQNICLAAGANDYIPKPIDVDKLLSLTRVWMSR